MSNKMPCGKENGICKDFDCQHNFFYTGLRLANPQETEKTASILNCCCLIDGPWTLDEVGQAWGVSRERIRQMERDAFIHFLILMKNSGNQGVREYAEVTMREVVKKEMELKGKKDKQKKGESL